MDFFILVDMEDFSNVAKSDKWKFHLSRDDNFSYLEKALPKKFDLIYLDSFHNADHIEKIFYYYYHKLNVGGFLFLMIFHGFHISKTNREIILIVRLIIKRHLIEL